jgi:copper chaperone CopZ
MCDVFLVHFISSFKKVYSRILFSNHSLIALFLLLPQMGFEAHVKVPAANGGAPGQPAGASMAQEATVQVLGMTCNSCVQNIEGVMGGRPGIASIRVTLADEEAVVRYDPALWSPQAIAEAIDDVCVPFFLYTLFHHSKQNV